MSGSFRKVSFWYRKVDCDSLIRSDTDTMTLEAGIEFNVSKLEADLYCD